MSVRCKVQEGAIANHNLSESYDAKSKLNSIVLQRKIVVECVDDLTMHAISGLCLLSQQQHYLCEKAVGFHIYCLLC